MNYIITDNQTHDNVSGQTQYNLSLQKIVQSGDETGKTTLFSCNNQKTENTISLTSFNKGSKSSFEGKSSLINQSITPKDCSNDCISNQATFSYVLANQSKQCSYLENQKIPKKSDSYIEELEQLELDSVQEKLQDNTDSYDEQSSQSSFTHNVWQNADDDLIIRGVDIESWRDKQGNPFNIFNLYKARSGQFETHRQNLSNQLVCNSIQRLYDSYSKERCLQEQYQGSNYSTNFGSSNSPSKHKQVITFSEFLQKNPFKDMNDYTQSGYNNIIFDRFKEYYQKYRMAQMKKYNYSPDRLEKQKSISQKVISSNDIEPNKTLFGDKFVRSKNKKRTIDVFNSPVSKPTEAPQNQNNFQLNWQQKAKFYSSSNLDLNQEQQIVNEKQKKQNNHPTTKNHNDINQIQKSQNNILHIQQLAAQQNQNLINKIYKEYSEQQTSSQDKSPNAQIKSQQKGDYLNGLPLDTLKNKIETMQKLVNQQKEKLLQQKQQEFYKQNKIYDEILAPLSEEKGFEQSQIAQKQIGVINLNSFNKSKSQEEIYKIPLVNQDLQSNNKQQKSRLLNQSFTSLNQNLCFSPLRKSSRNISNKSPINQKPQIKTITQNLKPSIEVQRVNSKENSNQNESQRSLQKQNFESPLHKYSLDNKYADSSEKQMNSTQKDLIKQDGNQYREKIIIKKQSDGNQSFKIQENNQLNKSYEKKQNFKNQLLQTFNTQRAQELTNDKVTQNQIKISNFNQTQHFLLKQSFKPQIINYNFKQNNSNQQTENSQNNFSEVLNSSQLNQSNRQIEDFSKYYNTYLQKQNKQNTQPTNNKILNVSQDTTPPANISTQDQSPLFFLNKNKQQLSMNKIQTSRLIQRIYNNNTNQKVSSQSIQNLDQIGISKLNESQLQQNTIEQGESKNQITNNYYIPLQTDQNRFYRQNSNLNASVSNTSNFNQAENQTNEQILQKNNISIPLLNKSYFKNTIQNFNFSQDSNIAKIKKADIQQLENINKSLNSFEQLSPLKKRIIKEDMLINKQSPNVIQSSFNSANYNHNNSKLRLNQGGELRKNDIVYCQTEEKEQKVDSSQFLLKKKPSFLSKTNRQQNQVQIEQKQLSQDIKNNQNNNSLLIKSGFQPTNSSNYIQEKRGNFQKTLQALYNSNHNKTFNK